MNQEEKLSRGIVSVLIANIINLGFNLLTNFLLPKFLSIESYADIKTFQLYVTYAGFLHLGYIDGMYLRYGGKEISSIDKKELSQDISTLRVFQIFVTAILLVLGLILDDFMVIAFGAAILPLNMATYFKFLYQATGEFNKYGKIMNATTIATFIINMVLVVFLKTNSSVLIVFSYVILDIIIWIFLEAVSKKMITIRLLCFSPKALKENIQQGFFLMLGTFSSILLTSMDRWFVKILMNVASFAQYSFAVSMDNFLNVAITPITVTLYNYFCKESKQERIINIRKYVIIFGTMIIAAAFPAKFVLEIFLQEYLDASAVVFLLFGSQLCYLIIKGIYVNLYKVQRMQTKYFYRVCLVVVIGFVFNVVCYRINPIKEAFAVGTLLSAFVWLYLSNRDFKSIKLEKNEIALIVCTEVAFLMIGMNLSAIAGFILYVVVEIVLYMLFMRQTVVEIIELLSHTLKKVMGKKSC